MLKAITTKTTGNSKIVASDGDGNSVRYDYGMELSFEERHDQAAIKLCEKMGWDGTLLKGFLGGKDNARVYVWLNESVPDTLIVPKSAKSLA